MKFRCKTAGVPFRSLAEQVVAAAVNGVLLIAFFANAVDDQAADCQDQRVGRGNKADFTEVDDTGSAVQLRPQPFEDNEREGQQSEMQDTIEQPESPVGTVQCNFHGDHSFRRLFTHSRFPVS